MQKLAVDALREAAFLQGDDHRPFRFDDRRGCDIGHALAMARRGEIDIAHADRGAAFAGLCYQLQDWTSEGHDLFEAVPGQEICPHVEELFPRRIDVQHLVAGADHQHGHGQGCRDLGRGLAQTSPDWRLLGFIAHKLITSNRCSLYRQNSVQLRHAQCLAATHQPPRLPSWGRSLL